MLPAGPEPSSDCVTHYDVQRWEVKKMAGRQKTWWRAFGSIWFQVTADVQWIDSFNPAADDDWLETLRVRTVF
jgi:hypothetical protein